MEDKDNDEPYAISKAHFFNTVGKFESKKSRSYQFIVITSPYYKLGILEVCRKLIEKEEVPNCFNLTTLVQLPEQDSQL